MFRVESKRFPNLQQFGSDGNSYSQAEIRNAVDYARDRGILTSTIRSRRRPPTLRLVRLLVEAVSPKGRNK